MQTSDHTDLAHANLIKDLMPQRDFLVGDKVVNQVGNTGTVSCVDHESIVVLFDHKDIHGYLKRKATDFTRLYTFSEIWAELPDRLPIRSCISEKVLTQALDMNIVSYAWFIEAMSPLFKDPIPANTAAELLKWVKERKE